MHRPHGKGVVSEERLIGGELTDTDLRGENMKFRKLMIAILGLAVVAGMTVPANAATHKHHRKHHHHHG